MTPYRIALIGHRDIYEYHRVQDGLEDCLRSLLQQKPFIEVYLGYNGDFDKIAASVIRRVQAELGSERCAMTLVLPYQNAHLHDFEKRYDSIYIPS